MGDKMTSTSDSGIPLAIFLENVDEFMSKDETKTADVVLRQLEEQHNKYKFMEYNLVTKKNRLKAQIPDLKISLDIIKFMQLKKNSGNEMESHYQISDTLYTKAKIPPTDKVCLWLGAKVMLEYNLDDAKVLLLKNEEAATKSLALVEEDLGFIRDQTTTIEVNMARVYNWDVKRKQKEKISQN